MRRVRFPISVVAIVAAIIVSTIGVAVAAQYPPKASTCAAAPSAGSPGIHVKLKGNNWMPNVTLAVQFQQPGATTPLDPATTDADGKFKVTETIPPGAHGGKAAIAVTGAAPRGDSITCYTNFQVVKADRTVAVIPTQEGIAITPGLLIVAIGFVLSLVIVRRRWARRFGNFGT